VGDNTPARQIVIDHGGVDPVLPAKNKGIYQKQSLKELYNNHVRQEKPYVNG
jgi:hypothetical protein